MTTREKYDAYAAFLAAGSMSQRSQERYRRDARKHGWLRWDVARVERELASIGAAMKKLSFVRGTSEGTQYCLHATHKTKLRKYAGFLRTLV